MSCNRPLHRGAAVLGIAALATGMWMPTATAADGDVSVINTETVQSYVTSSGEVESSRVYEQLALTGTGSVDLRNPIETDGVRNLDGFGGWDMVDGEQVATVDVDQQERLRSVSDYNGDLPLGVSVVYALDGERVEPGDVVGESGELEVQFTVENQTAQPQELTFDDGNGGTVTRTVDVPIPIVGSLTTTAPENFTDVRSEQANLAGDGKGGTSLSFTMTLFPPIGSTTAVFGYTADIVDGVVPRANITALPVNPLDVPSFKSAGDSYQGGAATGAELTAGAIEIDSNLLKLRDGAAELLGGLIQLRDGAGELETGLAGKAAPGSRELADGAVELDAGLGLINSGANRLSEGSTLLYAGTNDLTDGTGKLTGGAAELAAGAGELSAGARELRSGAGELSAGAGRLAGGTGDALAGSKKLTGGLQQISGGLGQLADAQKGLPAAQDGIQQLKAGVDLVLAGLGDADTDGSIIGGLADLEDGLGRLDTGATTLTGGLQQLTGAEGLPKAKGGVDQVKTGLDSSLSAGGSLDRLQVGLEAVRDNFCATHPAAAAPCTNLVDQLLGGVAGSRSDLTLASGGLGQVSAGLATAIGALSSQLIPGAQQIDAGISEARDGAGRLQGGSGELKAGVQQVRDGLGELEVGITDAVEGVFALNTGALDAAAGGSDLTAGLGKIDAGATELADGSVRLADGTVKLADGSVKLADGTVVLADGTVELDAGADKLNSGAGELVDGAGKLADGTGDAVDGSGRLADGAGELASGLEDAANGTTRLTDGLEEAAAGAPKLVDGAQRLSDEGTSKLIEAGEGTAQNFGELYATMEAGAQRADAEKMAYGAPEGATGLTAYSFIIKGEDGESGRNLARGLGGLAILGAGAGVFAWRRGVI